MQLNIKRIENEDLDLDEYSNIDFIDSGMLKNPCDYYFFRYLESRNCGESLKIIGIYNVENNELFNLKIFRDKEISIYPVMLGIELNDFICKTVMEFHKIQGLINE